MAYYRPCKNCAIDKDQCSRRAEIAKGIAGLSVTVVNFRCQDRTPLFAAGQRVAFDWTSWEPGYEGDSDYGLGLVYHGTVIQECKLRFIVRVDDAPSADEEKIQARDTFKAENLVIKVKPSSIRKLREPMRKLCPSCSAYPGEEGRCLGWGDGSFNSYWPSGCLRKKEAA